MVRAIKLTTAQKRTIKEVGGGEKPTGINRM